jgi:large subunit ribosomal protein L24e
MIELGRIPRRTTWTRAAKREKEIALAAAVSKETAPAPVEEKAKKTTASKVRQKKQSPPKPKE